MFTNQVICVLGTWLQEEKRFKLFLSIVLILQVISTASLLAMLEALLKVLLLEGVKQ